ncbi:MAG: tyrosine-type recombinase/integrase [Paludibacteraceae bacterium]|nr:tyrosine-type recombinase/integrase [Paludibacteraceae bacterium]
MIAKFLDYITIERRYSRLTAEAYERDLREFCTFLGADPAAFDPALVSEADIKEWMIGMLDGGISPRSVCRKLSTLRSFWKYLLRIGYVRSDVTRRIIPPKTDKPLPVFFRESEMEREHEAAQAADDFVSVRDSLVIEMLYQTGMRQAELLSLTDAGIDRRAASVRVFGKRSKERIIPVGDTLLEQILQYQQWRDHEWGIVPDRPLLLDDKGRPLSKKQLYNIVRARMGEVSSLRKQSPHVLRHTFATTMLDHGAGINTIKELLGHANLAATQVYTHTTFEQVKREYRKAHPRAKRRPDS